MEGNTSPYYQRPWYQRTAETSCTPEKKEIKSKPHQDGFKVSLKSLCTPEETSEKGQRNETQPTEGFVRYSRVVDDSNFHMFTFTSARETGERGAVNRVHHTQESEREANRRR